jgi:hypothetical protein
MELLACEHRGSLQKRRPDGECGRTGTVIDEFTNQSFDLGTFENEDNRLVGQKHAVPLEARQPEPVGRAPGDDLGSALAGAWHEGGNNCDALIRAWVGGPGSVSAQ